MVEIIPAIVPKNFEDLEEKLAIVRGLVPAVQIDIVDGVFASPRTWPHNQNPDSDFVRIIREEEGFPFWEDFDFEFHLMVSRPEEEFQNWISAGARRIIVHRESFKDAGSLESFARDFKEQFGGNGSLVSTELGVAFNMETSPDDISAYKESVSYVQFMSINKIGQQGEAFNPEVLEKIRKVRELNPELPVSVDGGVSLDNASDLISAGATRLVVGSAIFRSEDILGTIEEFKSL